MRKIRTVTSIQSIYEFINVEIIVIVGNVLRFPTGCFIDSHWRHLLGDVYSASQ